MHDYKNDEVVTMQLLEAIFAHCACFTIFYCSFTDTALNYHKKL